MNIHLKTVLDIEFDQLFASVKQGIYPYVDQVFGWDDEFQKCRFVEEYESDWFYWVYVDNIHVGLLCFKPYENNLHVHFLIIFPKFQKNGYGELTMRYVQHLAQTESRKSITLSSFTVNAGAIAFYKRLGYELVEADDDFQSFSLKLL